MRHRDTEPPGMHVQAGIRQKKRKFDFVALCAFAIALPVPAEAQSRNEADHATEAEQLLLVRSKRQSGEYDAARHILLEALSKAPNSPYLLGALGLVEQDLGEYLEAERSYLRALNASAQPAAPPRLPEVSFLRRNF